MEKLIARIEELTPAYVQFWKEICEIETPSHDKARLDTLVDRLERHAREKGFGVYREAFEKAGDCLRVDLPGDESKEPIVLMAHMDTVHNAGAFGAEPVTIRDGIIYGPGVVDCKGGITMAFLVLEALKDIGASHPPVRLLLTSDEEISARLSKQQGIAFFETHAKGAKAVLNCETGFEGKLTVGRKGIVHIRLEITGKDAHAGSSYFDGVSAVREAAHKIVALETLSQPGGNTYNCGVIHGGDKTNIVPQSCTVEIDARSLEQEGLDEVIAQVKQVAEYAYVPGSSCAMEVVSVRPPMPPTEANRALFDRINAIAAAHGMRTYEPFVSGGGSDAAYTTRMGIPTVCAIGPSGKFFHTRQEQANVASLPERAKLVACCILEL